MHGVLNDYKILVAERGLWRTACRGRAWSLLAAHLCAGALGFDLVPSALVACLRRRRGD